MKLYHFGLIFAVIFIGFSVTAQIRSLAAMKEEEIRRTEYDCLVAAVDAAMSAVFTGEENIASRSGLQQAEEVFFQMLSILHDGTPDAAGRSAWQAYVPCLVVFDEKGYYRYYNVPGHGWQWSEITVYQEEGIPESFFSEMENLLAQYHNLHYNSSKQYRLEKAERGIWEQSLSRACVFAVYAPECFRGVGKEQGIFLYAAAQRAKEAYFVTEDQYCHLPSCEQYEKSRVIARYATQKESAKDGALPCPGCLKGFETEH